MPSQLPTERVSGAQWSDCSYRLEENARMILGQKNADDLSFKKETF
jgi:hypothetical protein